jgi:hypothetical protein
LPDDHPLPDVRPDAPISFRLHIDQIETEVAPRRGNNDLAVTEPIGTTVMSKRAQVVIMGILGRTPLAGVSWQVLQYLEGFRRLGYDCYYIEDTKDWPYKPGEPIISEFDSAKYAVNREYAVKYIARVMAWLDLGDRWAYRSRIDGRLFGLSESRLSSVLCSADVLINLTGSTWLFEEHLRIPVRIYLETDPVIRQIEVATGDRDAIELLSAHTHHFTYGENLGAPDCGVPATEFDYHPTRPPIIMDWWTKGDWALSSFGDAGQSVYTTIGNLVQTGKDLEWNGEKYLWSKHFEFLKLIDLPKRTPQRLELSLLCKTAEDAKSITLLKSHGWLVRDALAMSTDILPYRDYILQSRGEFTVAKDQNIRLRSGWFSDRSACYLAAGRPVVTQDTAFGNVLPTGSGLFSFRTMEDIVKAFDAIESDYQRHCLAAREIAAEYFAAEKVLGRLTQGSGL